MATIDLASNSALLSVAEKLAEQNQLLSSIAVRGKSAFIRYSAYNDGTDFTETWSAGQNYIGHAVDFEAPTDKSAYTWSLFASNMRETLNVTLAADAWVNGSQTIETLAIGENSTVFPTPSPESKEDYLNAGVMISAATANSLVFTCLNTPVADITVTVFVTEPSLSVGGGNAGSESGLGQSDWEAGEGEPGEILNKPFGDIMLYAFNSRDEFLNGQDIAVRLEAGETYTVAFDGVSYTCVAKDYEGNIRLGNNDIYEVVETTKPEPFVIEQTDSTIYGYLAEADTAEHTVQVIFTKKLDPKFSGASWDALSDKPFYEGTVDLGDTITWDGTFDENTVNIDPAILGMPEDAVGVLAYQHISTSVPTLEELQSGSFSAWFDFDGSAVESNLTGDNIELTESDGVIYVNTMTVLVATKENAVACLDGIEIITLPKTGIYVMYEFMEQGGHKLHGYVTELSIPGYNFQMHGVQKLDPKFVHTPDWNAEPGQPGEILNRPFGEVVTELGDTVTWDGTYDENTVKQYELQLGGITGLIHTQLVSSSVPTIEDVQSGFITLYAEEGDLLTENLALDSVTFENQSGVITATTRISTANGKEYLPLLIATKDNVTGSYNDYPVRLIKKGIYFLEICTTGTRYSRISISDFMIPGYNFEITSVKKLDTKYVHQSDWNAGNGDGGEILNRPCYEYTQKLGDTATWDGYEMHENDYKMDLASMLIMHAHYIANEVPTVEELLTGKIEYTKIDGSNDKSYKGAITESMIAEQDGVIAITDTNGNGTYFMIVTTTDSNTNGVTLNKPGLYGLHIKEGSDYVQCGKSLTIPGYNFTCDHFKKLDTKFIDTPDWDAVKGQAGYIKNRPFGTIISNTSDTLSSEGRMQGTPAISIEDGLFEFYHVSSETPTIEELTNGGTLKITVDAAIGGEDTEAAPIVAENIQYITADETAYLVLDSTLSTSGMPALMVVLADETAINLDGITATLNKGIYFASIFLGIAKVDYLHIPGFNKFIGIGIKTLETKYLPEHLQFGDFSKAPIIRGEEAANAPGFMLPECFYMAKVSDRILTKNDFKDCVFTLYSQSEDATWTVGGPFTFWDMDDQGSFAVYDQDYSYTLAAVDVHSGEGQGVYFANMVDFGDYVVTKLEFPQDIRTIDEKYLPEGVGYEEVIKYDTLEWDGTVDEANDVVCTDGQIIFHKVSDDTPAVYELTGGTCTSFVDGQDIVTEINSYDWDCFDDYDYCYVGPVVIVRKENTTIDYGLFTEPGIYFGYQNDALFVKAIKAAPGAALKSETILHQIDPKYIPTSSGSHSWNDLTDKPFGNQGVTVEWTGALADAEVVEGPYDDTFVKLTDRVFTVEELANAVITFSDDTTGSFYHVDDTGSAVYAEENSYGNSLLLVSTYARHVISISGSGELEFSSAGTYVRCETDAELPKVIKLELPNAYQTINDNYISGNFATRAMLEEEAEQRRLLENAIGFNNTWGDQTMADIIAETFATKDDISEVVESLSAFETRLGFVTTGLEEKTVAETIYDELVTKASVTTAAIGQTIVVKAVDENGRPTKWEAVDMPTFELVSPNGTRFNLAVADDGSLSAVAIVEEPTEPEVTDPEEPAEGEATEE